MKNSKTNLNTDHLHLRLIVITNKSMNKCMPPGMQTKIQTIEFKKMLTKVHHLENHVALDMIQKTAIASEKAHRLTVAIPRPQA